MLSHSLSMFYCHPSIKINEVMLVVNNMTLKTMRSSIIVSPLHVAPNFWSWSDPLYDKMHQSRGIPTWIPKIHCCGAFLPRFCFLLDNKLSFISTICPDARWPHHLHDPRLALYIGDCKPVDHLCSKQPILSTPSFAFKSIFVRYNCNSHDDQ